MTARAPREAASAAHAVAGKPEARADASWRPPSEERLDRIARLFAPWRAYTDPCCSGVRDVPVDRPFLLVGNHTLLGVLDVPLMMLLLRERTGLFPRAVGDHAHFGIPLWAAFLESVGVVDGTRENCRALMQAGESVLIFPGGAREVSKRHGEKYELVWGERTGFARLAIEFDYPIVPLSALGAEDAYDVVVDVDQMLGSPLGWMIRRWVPRPELVPPIVRGWGPTWIPRPVRFYFHFGEPIETRDLAGRAGDPAAAAAVRDRVRAAVEIGLGRLMLQRARDPRRTLAGRLAARVRRGLQSDGS